MGKKNDEGITVKVICFELQKDSELVQIIEIPPRKLEDVTIEVARTRWKKLVEEGYSRIDKRVAIAFSARINEKEEGERLAKVFRYQGGSISNVNSGKLNCIDDWEFSPFSTPQNKE